MDPKNIGRYQIKEKIGEGAMGRVYRAFDPDLERVVAVRTVRPEALGTGDRDEYLERFRREAEAAGRLAHPSLVGVFDVGEDYMVMEFVQGQTLEDLLKPGPLDLAQALNLLTPVADAIDYAHQAGVVHRDIKPGNIMVEPDGRPKLMDFGVARLEPGAVSASGSYLGSPSYMAPEQVRGGEVTAAADLFSFAVVAYEAITGHRPFKGDNVATIVHRVAHEDARSPRSWNRSLPRGCDAIFERALAKDPARRFENALSFIAALEEERLDQVSSSANAAGDATLVGAAPEPEVPARMGAAPGPKEARPLGSDTVPRKPLSSRGSWLPWLVTAAALVAMSVALVWSRWRPVAPTVPASPAIAPGAELRIEAEPEGATVWIDGVQVGTAPLTLKDLKPGPHQVRVLEDGYAPAELGLEVKEGMRSPPLRFVMAPVGAPLSIESLPEGATVHIDGRAVEGPLESLVLGPGQHEVRVEAKGFLPRVERVEAEPGKRLAIEARLEPVPTPPPTPVSTRPRRTPSPPATQPPAPTLAATLPPTPPPVTRGAMVELDDAVTPPKRVSGDPARYPQAARKLGLKGSVLVELTVSEDGEPLDIHIIESAGEILDRAVVAAVEKWRFTPALRDGEEVRVRWKYKQTFMPTP